MIGRFSPARAREVRIAVVWLKDWPFEGFGPALGPVALATSATAGLLFHRDPDAVAAWRAAIT